MVKQKILIFLSFFLLLIAQAKGAVNISPGTIITLAPIVTYEDASGDVQVANQVMVDIKIGNTFAVNVEANHYKDEVLIDKEWAPPTPGFGNTAIDFDGWAFYGIQIKNIGNVKDRFNVTVSETDVDWYVGVWQDIAEDGVFKPSNEGGVMPVVHNIDLATGKPIPIQRNPLGFQTGELDPRRAGFYIVGIKPGPGAKDGEIDNTRIMAKSINDPGALGGSGDEKASDAAVLETRAVGNANLNVGVEVQPGQVQGFDPYTYPPGKKIKIISWIKNVGSIDATDILIDVPVSTYTDYVPGSIKLEKLNADGTLTAGYPISLTDRIDRDAGQVIIDGTGVASHVQVGKPLIKINEIYRVSYEAIVKEGTSPGTVITLAPVVKYKDASGDVQTAHQTMMDVEVGAIYGVNVESNHYKDSILIDQDVDLQPDKFANGIDNDGWAYYGIQIKNIGNIKDRFKVQISETDADWYVAVWEDISEDGVFKPSEEGQVIPMRHNINLNDPQRRADPGALPLGFITDEIQPWTSDFYIVGVKPDRGALAGDIDNTHIMATSINDNTSGDAKASNSKVLETEAVGWANINVGVEVEPNQVQGYDPYIYPPGKEIKVVSWVKNVGRMDVKEIVVDVPVSTYTTYVPESIYLHKNNADGTLASGYPIHLTDRQKDDKGEFILGGTGVVNHVRVTIPGIGINEVFKVKYSCTVNDRTSPGTVITLYPTVTYKDASGDIQTANQTMMDVKVGPTFGVLVDSNRYESQALIDHDYDPGQQDGYNNGLDMDGWAFYGVKVKNTGNAADRFKVELSETDTDWYVAVWKDIGKDGVFKPSEEGQVIPMAHNINLNDPEGRADPGALPLGLLTDKINPWEDGFYILGVKPDKGAFGGDIDNTRIMATSVNDPSPTGGSGDAKASDAKVFETTAVGKADINVGIEIDPYQVQGYPPYTYPSGKLITIIARVKNVGGIAAKNVNIDVPVSTYTTFVEDGYYRGKGISLEKVDSNGDLVAGYPKYLTNAQDSDNGQVVVDGTNIVTHIKVKIPLVEPNEHYTVKYKAVVK